MTGLVSVTPIVHPLKSQNTDMVSIWNLDQQCLLTSDNWWRPQFGQVTAMSLTDQKLIFDNANKREK